MKTYDPLANSVDVAFDDNGEPEPEVIEVTPDRDGEDAAVSPTLEYDEADPNLAFAFSESEIGKAAAKRIGEQVVLDFKNARDDSTEYRDAYTKMLRLIDCDLPKKQGTASGAANANVPLALQNLGILVYRIYDEVIKKEKVFEVVALGPNDEEAQILTRHGNWRIRNTVPEFKRQIRRAILCFLIGDVRSKVWYDTETRMDRYEVLTPDQLLVPFNYTTVTSDFSDVPYMVEALYRYDHELEDKIGEWYGLDKILKVSASWDDESELDMDEELAAVTGIDKPTEEGRAPHLILQWEGWLMLPNQKRQRFCQAIVHESTATLLKLEIHERPDWRDRARYDSQVAEGQAYEQALEAHRMAAEEQQAVAEQALVAGGVAPPPPPPAPPAPDWYAEGGPEPPRMVPLHMYQHGVCMESIVGSGGIGFGRMLADFQRAANKALSQFQDSATWANMQMFVTNQREEIVPSRLALKFGMVLRCPTVATQDLDKVVYPLRFPAANPQLLETVKWAKESAERVVQTTEALGGSPGKSGETFRGLAARIEQATKNYSVAAGIFCDEYLTQVLQALAYLDSLWLDPNEHVWMADKEGPIPVTREMYQRTYRTEICADLRFSTTAQKVAEWEAILDRIITCPATQQNGTLQIAVLGEMLKLMGKGEIVPLLQPPPAPPMLGPGGPQQGPGQQGQPGAPPGAPQLSKPPGPMDGIPGRPPGG
jgi:hypothetical protein